MLSVGPFALGLGPFALRLGPFALRFGCALRRHIVAEDPTIGTDDLKGGTVQHEGQLQERTLESGGRTHLLQTA